MINSGEIVITTPSMLAALSLAVAQKDFLKGLDLSKLLTGCISYTYITNRPVVSIGIQEREQGVAYVWALFDKDIGSSNFLRFHRLLKSEIEKSPFDRIEAHVLASHVEGYRWARLLGFECEGLCRKFSGGLDFYQFSLVR